MAGFLEVEGGLFIPDWTADTNYFKDQVVVYSIGLYRCKGDHNSGLVFDIVNWDSLLGGGVGSVPSLKEVAWNGVMPVGQNLTLALDTTFNKYDIRTVYLTSNQPGNLKVTIYEKAVDGNIVYQSLAQQTVYDIANVPCEDKDETRKLHLIINNLTGAEATVSFRAKVTNLN